METCKKIYALTITIRAQKNKDGITKLLKFCETKNHLLIPKGVLWKYMWIFHCWLQSIRETSKRVLKENHFRRQKLQILASRCKINSSQESPNIQF